MVGSRENNLRENRAGTRPFYRLAEKRGHLDCDGHRIQDAKNPVWGPFSPGRGLDSGFMSKN